MAKTATITADDLAQLKPWLPSTMHAGHPAMQVIKRLESDFNKPNSAHPWDFATGDEYVEIEAVSADDVLYSVASIPCDCPNAEEVAETICNAHNKEIGQQAPERT